MTDSEPQDTPDGLHGPDFDVWNHLDSGWQMAHDDIARKLDPETFEFYHTLAKVIVGLKSNIRVDPVNSNLGASLNAIFPDLPKESLGSVYRGLLKAFASRKDPWLIHAVELELGGSGISRATEALIRFRDLAPQLAGRSIPDSAVPYVREVVASFLFGFDAATIALCRTILEKVSKDVLLKLGVYTEPQFRRDKPDLETMLRKLREADALLHSSESAERVRVNGNTVLHKHLFDEKIRRKTAIDTIEALKNVLAEILP